MQRSDIVTVDVDVGTWMKNHLLALQINIYIVYIHTYTHMIDKERRERECERTCTERGHVDSDIWNH